MCMHPAGEGVQRTRLGVLWGFWRALFAVDDGGDVGGLCRGREATWGAQIRAREGGAPERSASEGTARALDDRW